MVHGPRLCVLWWMVVVVVVVVGVIRDFLIIRIML